MSLDIPPQIPQQSQTLPKTRPKHGHKHKRQLPRHHSDPHKNQPQKAFKHLNLNTKMQIPFKYGLAEKFSPIDISARRNIFAQISAYKNVLINVIGYFGIIFSQRVAW
jgi:hypothetical protein